MPLTEADLAATAQKVSGLPAGIAWKLTYCDFADNKFFCELEAPSKEAIEQVFKANNLRFDAIYPFKLFNLAMAELES